MKPLVPLEGPPKLTLLDLTKRGDAGGASRLIIEDLSRRNPILDLDWSKPRRRPSLGYRLRVWFADRLWDWAWRVRP